MSLLTLVRTKFAGLALAIPYAAIIAIAGYRALAGAAPRDWRGRSAAESRGRDAASTMGVQQFRSQGRLGHLAAAGRTTGRPWLAIAFWAPCWLLERTGTDAVQVPPTRIYTMF